MHLEMVNNLKAAPLLGWSEEWDSLLSVAVAILDEQGKLITSNAGFRRIIGGTEDPTGTNASWFFVQPTFATLVRGNAGAAGDVYRGGMTIGDQNGHNRMLNGRVWRAGTRLYLLAEYDVVELERLLGLAFEINERVAASELSLAESILMLKRREAQSRAESLTDALTGLANRRALEQALHTEIERSRRNRQSLCALMADLDHFKQVNDTYGHAVGDKALEAFADVLRASTRATDVLIRFGGEEFIVLMPATALAAAVDIAERIRVSFAERRVDPVLVPLTASFGVVELGVRESGPAFLLRADDALYQAKAAGRNTIVGGPTVPEAVEDLR